MNLVNFFPNCSQYEIFYVLVFKYTSGSKEISSRIAKTKAAIHKEKSPTDKEIEPETSREGLCVDQKYGHYKKEREINTW